MRLPPPPLLLLLGLGLLASADDAVERISSSPIGLEPKRWHVPCAFDHYAEGGLVQGCHPTDCRRVIHDGFIGRSEVDRLISIAERAMAAQPSTGGPCIADINSGYVLAGSNLINIYSDEAASPLFTAADYTFYKGVIERIKGAIDEEFGVEVHFTSPTFITRIVGSSAWKPQSLHDEYWHPHVDKNNTAHYDYSGLLYLSEYGKDFKGGLFEFFHADGRSDTLIEPAPGRLFIFTSGRENPHRVQKVTGGTRYVLSFWFTCREEYSFTNFLDGKAHRRFKGRPEEEGEGEEEEKAAGEL